MIRIRPMQKFLQKCVPFMSCEAKRSSDAVSSFVQVMKNDEKKTATVVMQRPPVNSLNLELLQQLTEAIKDLEKNSYKGLILSSNSPTVFSAGLDIMEMCKPKEERLKNFWKSLQEMWKTLYLTPLVTIAAVNGHAPAGGCLLAMSCDHCLMVNSRASIGLNETKLGILAPKWFCDLFISTIGFSQAEHALKLGKLFTPEEALKLGLVHALIDSPAELMDRAQLELDNFLKIPNPAFRATKIETRKVHVGNLKSYEKQEVEQIVHFVNQEETQKFLAAYLKTLKK